MNLTYCDLCKKEIKKDEDIFYLKFIDRKIMSSIMIPLPEICNKCREIIQNKINELKK